MRYVPPDCPLVEVTCRTMQGRLLLRPSKELNQIVYGLVARSARLYGVGVCAFVFLSNHCHLLLRPRDAKQLSAFMGYLNGNLAREAGRLHHWREKFWGRRYRDISVSFEPEAQIARLKYLLAQGCKENLVARPQDWPGATSIHALVDAEPIMGVWYDRTRQYRSRCRQESRSEEEFASAETLDLVPLPCWEGMDAGEIRELVEKLLEAITEEARCGRAKSGVRPMGREKILRQHPHRRPRGVVRSSAPRFHAASFEIRRMLEAMYREYRDAYADARDRLRRSKLPVRFPRHGIPPPYALTV